MSVSISPDIDAFVLVGPSSPLYIGCDSGMPLYHQMTDVFKCGLSLAVDGY